METSKPGSSELERSHREEQAIAKQIWLRFEGRSRLKDIREEEIGKLRESRREDGLGKDTELYMMSEGRRIDWGGLGDVQAGRVVEVGLMMRGGGKKKCRQIHLTRHFSHAVCTIHFMHITLHGSRRATQRVCVRASFHLHVIHDVCLSVRCCPPLVSLRCLPLLFHALLAL